MGGRVCGGLKIIIYLGVYLRLEQLYFLLAQLLKCLDPRVHLPHPF
jgi:hypothetical protein